MIVKKLGRWFRSIDYTKILNWITPEKVIVTIIIGLFCLVVFVPGPKERDNYVKIIYQDDIENYRNIIGDKEFIKSIDGCLTGKYPGFYKTGKNGNTLLFGCELFKNSIIEFDSKIMWDKKND